MRVTLGVLGLVLAATTAYADLPKEATIFGQKYALDVHSLGGKYANGLTVTQPPEDDKSCVINFAQGETLEKDRLFVGQPHRDTDEFTVTGTFYLTGSGANGNFDPKTANVTLLFGGDQDKSKHGRLSTITWLNDTETGKKKDRNLVATSYTDTDNIRFYDLDSMSEGFDVDPLLSLEEPVFGTNTDPGMPYTGPIAGAKHPSGMLIFAGRGQNEDKSAEEGTEIGVMDPTKDSFFDVKTDPATATKDQKVPIANLAPLDFEQIQDNEYLLLQADPNGRGAARATQLLHRLKITLPDNLATAGPESVKIESEAVEQLLATDPDDATVVTKDVLGVGTGGVTGIAVGRPVAENGPRRLYFSTFSGELITATPVLPTAGN